MSILKSILHRWNKDSKSYDTLHPETEVAQITDFADGIVSKLAATTAISAISALQTDSWFGKMMKWVLDASGVKYLIDTNGYVCFGSLFGGLIIQWGNSTNDPGMGAAVFYFPVTCNPCIALAGTTKLGLNNYVNDAVIRSFETTECKIDSTSANYAGNFRVVVIGRN